MSVLSAAEREQVLHSWNDTAGGGPERVPVHVQFAAQAARTPDACAVTQGRGDSAVTLTYRELDERSNQLAHHLVAQGVAVGACVGLCVERTPSMLVGMFGILKAGAAYVPLDPLHPAERLGYVVADAGVSLLVTQGSLAGRFADGAASVVCLDGDADGAALAAQPTGPCDASVHPESLCYMIYTSGSTGQPKGVMTPHRALTNYVEYGIEAFEMSADDRVLQFASISFDTAAEEIYPTLLTGGTLVLRTDDMIASAEAFVAACDELGITLIDFPTAYWHVITTGLAEVERPFPTSVRFVILGGEKAKPEQLEDWFARVGHPDAGGPIVFNSYGPTEGTIVGTAMRLDRHELDAPIGRPVRNVQAYVLDPHGEPVPVGVPGELHLAGEGLAHGYHGQPALTAERFVPDPFSSVPGARMYKTGDVVRHRPDGALQFLGRRDNQVKFRGYRIELEEIEKALARHVGIEEAVALLREDTPGNPRLVAYVVGGADAPDAAELRRDLTGVLPGYMVPSHTVFLDAMPLTPHGKVDKGALPPPDRSAAPARDAGYVAPRTPLETQIAALWQRVLEVERVGAHDNFFDLGGHSLLLMQVIGELKKSLGIPLDPGEMVLPTLAQLASLCEEKQAEVAAGGGDGAGEGGGEPGEGDAKGGFMSRLAKRFRPAPGKGR